MPPASLHPLLGHDVLAVIVLRESRHEIAVVRAQADAVDHHALTRLAELDLVELSANGRGEELRLTRRGRFLGGRVTAELLALGVD